MLRFTEDEYRRLTSKKPPDLDLAVFVRSLALRTLSEPPKPPLRETIAFTIATFLEDISYEQVLKAFDSVIPQLEHATDEVYEE